ncbi:TPA: GtrA family protein [Campylobacter fetus subsp. venerealis]|uniref:Polysaccharide biosynthesis protein, GtrA family n=1 Tax=Campylobacter fetus subsp. venerealis NCTC 10354 TaxID=983328 RepID=A0AAE6MAF3_CAMFE|nr:GtrA family protein [Campylobacter fetus]OCS22650.1 polysaccharide synthesis protein GtrA [Campylobacter fetus subsp. venerealis cfvi97/532]OCS26922.1 polysaccharide synthesis protein GtrA [Campylobacter fetus subsp. venerealis cfvB10]OCS30056.1 polysaccharide synthesis protein GtrA [Campylobacter fetus subsp. venerealis LMG 6570 = CCUG 33900]OCS42351.1 polysaccharide synthesis protein GtrA [Campylobacter fetus subsp. venerealis cfvi02/298]AHE94717.1 polysaccharide biosynthesis protein, Gtr
MKLSNSYFLRYLCVGVLNTIVGFGIIFTLMYIGYSAEISNLIGYICGIIFSYFMNKFFTFNTKNRNKKEFIKFIIAMLISYVLNLLMLKTCLSLGINAYIAQLFAGAAYTVSGFLISKFWVFKLNS